MKALIFAGVYGTRPQFPYVKGEIGVYLTLQFTNSEEMLVLDKERVATCLNKLKRHCVMSQCCTIGNSCKIVGTGRKEKKVYAVMQSAQLSNI